MNSNTETIILFNLKTVIICICILSFILAILQIIELIRYRNYGKVSMDEEIDCKECLWRRKTTSANNIDIFQCIRPRILCRSITCKGQCKFMKYSNLPIYPKSLICLVLEAILAVINFIIVAVGFAINIL